jgi:hypothetical protein
MQLSVIIYLRSYITESIFHFVKLLRANYANYYVKLVETLSVALQHYISKRFVRFKMFLELVYCTE